MRDLIEVFDDKFRQLHLDSCQLVRNISDEKLYWQPLEKDSLFPVNSCGEYVLRSAGKVEQTFGGITTKLWDDPFEWTLPEQLPTAEMVIGYLDEVEETRRQGFNFFQSDEDLRKNLPAPVKIVSLFELLLETLITAGNYQGRALAIYKLFGD